MATTAPVLDYYTILDDAPAHVVRCALELGVLDAVGESSLRGIDIAGRLHVSPVGSERLLNALEAIGLVARRNNAWQVTAAGDTVRRGDRLQLIHDLTSHAGAFDAVWAGLDEAVRSGKGALTAPDAFFAAMNVSLERLHRRPAERLATLLGIGAASGSTRILDVGCGSAIWSRACVAVDRRCRVTAQDLPGVLEHTRATVAAERLDDCFDYRPGSLLDDDIFGVEEFDAVIVAHVLHLFGSADNKTLIARAARALRPGGTLVVVEFLRDDLRHGRFMAFFALLMLVLSPGGDTWTRRDIADWISAAGLRLHRTEIDPESPATFLFSE